MPNIQNYYLLYSTPNHGLLQNPAFSPNQEPLQRTTVEKRNGELLFCQDFERILYKILSPKNQKDSKT
jgi:hypothetical protein